MNSSSQLFYYMHAGEVCGPVPVDALKRLYLSGHIEDGAICAEDNASWTTYGEQFPAPKTIIATSKDNPQKVILTGISLPFDQLVILLFKLGFASITVSVIFAVAGFLFFLGLVFLGLANRP